MKGGINMKQEAMVRWTRENAVDLYGIKNWGTDFFDISDKGEIVVRPLGSQNPASVSIMDLVNGLKERGLSFPVLLRFADVLASRIQQLYASFQDAISSLGYQGEYRGVYPIKVNQQQQVVAEIMEFGRPYHHGLEAGSKAELMAAMAYTDDPEALIVCNGYKDEEFVDLALSSRKIGLQTILVIERPGEVPLILNRAAALRVRPRLGVRIKLSSRAGGHWDGSGGDRSMFGVNSAQLIEVLDQLRAGNMLDSLHMLHYHLGSQIPNIRNIKSALREACRFYVELVKEGAPMGLFNVGGGLAVDYDGSHTNFASSRNYTKQEYATDVVEEIMEAANEAGIPHPTIVSESGRATVAHHSVLVFNVLDAAKFQPCGPVEYDDADVPDVVSTLLEIRNHLTSKNFQEYYHDALDSRDQMRTLFEQGQLSLRHRAQAENVFWEIMCRVAQECEKSKYVPDELENIPAALSDLYYCNFSVFQSLPDSWAIGQLFPVMPVHRLNEMPTRHAIFSDITCDSDGKIDHFIDLHDIRHALPVHDLNDEDYFFGVFLVGAYQETLGDLHNLLGDTHVLHIRLGRDGQFEYTREIAGDTVADVLSYVEYDPREMVSRVRNLAEQAVRDGIISATDRRDIMQTYEDGMRGYTYFES